MKKARKSKRFPFGSTWWPLNCPRPGDPRFERLPWPSSVPVLVAEDVCINHTYPLTRPPYNLDGWLESVFNPRQVSTKEMIWVENIAGMCIEVVLTQRTQTKLAVWEYAWLCGVTDAMVASVWNEAMAMLGYDTSNPERAKDEYEEFFRIG